MYQFALMSKKSVFCLGVLLVLCCGTAESVKCYVCSSKDNETMCNNPERYNLGIMKCDQTVLENTRSFARSIYTDYDKIFAVDIQGMAKHVDLDCLKVVTRVGNKDFIFRGCQLAEQSSLDICVKMDKFNTDYLRKVYCSRCSTDGCNLAANPPKLTVPILLYLFLFKIIIFLL